VALEFFEPIKADPVAIRVTQADVQPGPIVSGILKHSDDFILSPCASNPATKLRFKTSQARGC
jgi:hypothetical protein